ncbi:TetR/AcrR family transcriptional regulator [Streptomyces sp. ME19-01-6]|uniref:TetR/AcrR family transcriptional regulator n=1 Tax=Streptomyces sp. ME19-01-6 TaxID=3028686 RepID=UPI0029A8D0D5|nr:TetR/AcrR family transcriptional regulator [Streptomyces sp. ME19-01-6]MDX3225440.1 TetR/AcrR family transcriptional regulator [Streptomyces sp. ME19-01-6]
MAEGLRERKKRQVKQRISDMATGLFLEHGFDAVTIAAVAEVADVSVNTIYNYFPAKEDLFFDREEEVVERPSVLVRERAAGVSAARAVLDRLRRDIAERDPYAGMDPGYPRFMQVVQESPTLMARVLRMQGRTVDRLAATLREETGAAADDPTPEFIAHQLVGMQNAVHRSIGRAQAEGGTPERISAELLRQIDVMESLLSDRVLNYAVKNTP